MNLTVQSCLPQAHSSYQSAVPRYLSAAIQWLTTSSSACFTPHIMFTKEHPNTHTNAHCRSAAVLGVFSVLMRNCSGRSSLFSQGPRCGSAPQSLSHQAEPLCSYWVILHLHHIQSLFSLKRKKSRRLMLMVKNKREKASLNCGSASCSRTSSGTCHSAARISHRLVVAGASTSVADCILNVTKFISNK